ncbi:hypothetical protein, partial [Streptomyces hydrogenans]|uniref:hypothetical protein n=1 Tax=Streptomyces hydrogenans TaxID=1873719 RepID=UPI0035E1E784
MRPGAQQRRWKHATAKTGHPGTKQDHVESSPIRNLTCPAENDSIDSLTSTAIQHPKKHLIGGSSGENDL